mmetsp:Transcript_72253/g.202794  ORF Transcript_72253/g.202794 Transcript_72253/m.202794 type:complete len:380 (+) Transcript_72253:97-1236(+)
MNICASAVRPEGGDYCHSNGAWWSSQVICATAEEVAPATAPESEGERIYKFVDELSGIEYWIRCKRLLLSGPPELSGSLLSRTITAFIEVRQPHWAKQPRSWPTYHAYTVLEVDNGWQYIICERKSDMLELIIGSENMPLLFMKALRATGAGRDPSRSADEPRTPVTSRITVRQFLGWIDGPVEETWQPYDMLQANCQHFSALCQRFLLDPGSGAGAGGAASMGVSPASLRSKASVLDVVRRGPMALKYLPEAFRCDAEVVLAAVAANGIALKYAPEEFRATAEVVLVALRSYGYSLPFVHPELRQRREVVLAAVRQNGAVLCYCSEEHRSDREVALAAVASNGYAVRYVGKALRQDPEILLASGLQSPLALLRASFLF